MKKINVIILTLILFIAGILPVFAKIEKTKNNADYRLEYLNLNWWGKYNDPILTDYITTAYKNNQDLKVATLNVKQSEQIVKEVFAAQLPNFGFQGDVSRDMPSSIIKFGGVIIPNYSQTNYSLPIAMSYEADIWGENYLKTKSMKKELDMVKQNERATYISLTSEVAAQYFNLLKLDKLIKDQNELIKIQTKVVEMTEAKYKSGLCPVTDIMTEKQILADLCETLHSYMGSQLIVSRQMIVLTGHKEMDVDTIPRADYSKLVLLNLPDGINAEAIKYRPDFNKTEIYIQKIGIDVKAARRDFLPKFKLYGDIGFNAYKLTNVFGHNTFMSSIGVLPSWDIFTGGAKMAHFRFEKFEYQKAQQIYEKTILTSVQEVNNMLGIAQINEMNYKESHKRLELESDKYGLSNQKYTIGAKSELENFKAKEAFLLAEKADVSNKIALAVSVLDIYKSIGGKDFTTINNNL